MNIQHRWIAIPLIILALVGCKEDKKEVKQNRAAVPQVEKKIILDEVAMMNHLRSFQEIALNHNGNRAVGTQGGEATKQYILEKIEKTKFKKTITTFNTIKNVTGQNIVVEIPGESNESVILIGAHYDSVGEGPGINDNASGVAVVLELMKQLSQTQIRPKHTIHLAFWDAEEIGLIGSKDYVSKLNEEQLKKIKAYINIDMVGTRHPTARIADTDRSSIALVEVKLKEQGMSREEIESELAQLRAIESHSKDFALEKSLQAFFESHKIPILESIEMIKFTDTASFTGKVPVVAFGLVNVISEDELVPCYHKSCDTIDLIDPKSLVFAGNGTIHLLKKLNAL